MAVVLIADDEPAIRALASMVLKSAGHDVIAAGNGLEAIALYRSEPADFDLVVTDLDMPVMDGFQLIELIRDSRPEAKIIAMTGNPTRKLPPGVALLPKPFSPQTLRESVAKALCGN